MVNFTQTYKLGGEAVHLLKASPPISMITVDLIATLTLHSRIPMATFQVTCLT